MTGPAITGRYTYWKTSRRARRLAAVGDRLGAALEMTTILGWLSRRTETTPWWRAGWYARRFDHWEKAREQLGDLRP
jgi:hypothetical protein